MRNHYVAEVNRLSESTQPILPCCEDPFQAVLGHTLAESAQYNLPLPRIMPLL